MQENKFKVGDKVRYIGKTIRSLRCGEECTVCGLKEEFGVFLTGVEFWLNVWRFELVESAEEHSYSVEQVIEAFAHVYNERFDNKHVVDEVKQELEKRKNPEYLKYLELKEKFEPSVF